jgi:uncharacterized phage infection (PIP) family protein YhgE
MGSVLNNISTREGNITMNNEEKILEVLEQVISRLDKVDSRLDKVDSRLDKVDSRLDKMEADIETIKEDAAVTRTATNTLLDWAEKAEVQIRIPLYNKAE